MLDLIAHSVQTYVFNLHSIINHTCLGHGKPIGLQGMVLSNELYCDQPTACNYEFLQVVICALLLLKL